MQAALDKFFPTPNEFAQVDEYNETGDKTIEFSVKRNYSNTWAWGLGIDFISDQDSSLLTGLDISVFQPFDGRPWVHCIPWYDKKFYCPKKDLYNLWKQEIKMLTSEEVKKIQIYSKWDSISVTMEFL